MNKKTGAGGEIYLNSEADRLSSQYGLDLASELTKILSEELASWKNYDQSAKEIDKDILRNLGFEPDRHKRRKNSINKIYKK